MNILKPILAALTLSAAALLHAQAPQIVSATKLGTSGVVRVTFNIPVTPAGTTTILSDDFSGAALDPAKWTVNDAGFEGGSTTSESTVEQLDGQLTIDLEGASPGWGGKSLRTANSYSASAAEPLIFEIDRVAHDEDASASRTGIWITDATRSRYILFAEADGEGGWQYNRLIGSTGDNPGGPGAISPLVNQEEFNDLATHQIKAVLNGATVRLYLDNQFATEISYPAASGIVFEFGAYAADTGDTLTGIFDNARVHTLVSATLSNFTINNGAAVTAVAATTDPRTLELVTTGLNAGGEYTLTVTGVQSLAGTPIQPNSTVSIKTGTPNATYAAAVLADEPVAYYPMDHNQGSAVPNLGTLGTAASYPDGSRSAITAGPGLPEFPGFDAGNTAALFDGIGTYTDDDDNVQLTGIGNYIDTGEFLLENLAAFTLEAWIKPAYLDEFRLGIAGTWGTEFGFNSPDEIHIYTGGGGVIYAPYPFPFHEWHHIVITGDGTNLTMYADGQQLAQIEEVTDSYDGEARNVFIGGGGIFDGIEEDGFGNWWPGGIDELAIYHKALSPDRVKAHFDAAFAAELHPAIAITSPLENATIAPGAAVPITVQASAAPGRTISKVEFYDRVTKLGESTTSPFTFTIPSISDGRHSLTARAYDDLGVSSVSSAVRFIVGAPKPLLVMVVASAENPTENDEEVRERLLGLDFDVQLISAGALVEADVTEAALVVVPVVRVDAVAELLRELPVPVLTWDQDLEPTFRFTADEVDEAWGDTEPRLYIDIVNADHPIAAGLPGGVLQVNEYPQEFAWGVPGAEAAIIATLDDDPERAVIYAYDKGAALADGSDAPEKRVFFMLTDDTYLALNDEALSLFDAAVAWARKTVEEAPRLNQPAIQQTGVTISWTGGGTLQAADAVSGPWTDVPGANSPHLVPFAGKSFQFFRVRK
jgi:hypothetical protein